MEPPVLAQMVADVARRVIPDLVPPALMPLPRTRVSAEVWDDEHHVRIVGEAIYAVHRGDCAWWAVVVQESNALQAGSVQLVALEELRCESPLGRRGG